MKLSWGLSVLVLGIVMGRVLVGSGDPSQNVFLLSDKNKNSGPQLQEYWNQTDINLKDLKTYVNDQKCFSTAEYERACLNSVLSGLKNTSYRLDLNGLMVLEKDLNQNINLSNERQALESYQALKVNSYEQLWSVMAKLIAPEKFKMSIALGINGFLSIHKDPHTYISPTRYFKEVSVANERSPYIIGLTFKKSGQDIIIKKVATKSDADYAGLKKQDQIVAINGSSVEKFNLNQISEIFRDRSQESFSLQIRRDGMMLVKKIVRSYRTLSQVNVDIIGARKNIGYIQLTKFARNVCEDVAGKISWLKENKVQGLVFDLRDNPGGLLSEAACLLGLFVGENQKAFSIKYLNSISEDEISYTTADKIFDGPMVVLTSNTSASASELVAGTLQEYKRAIIMGQRTFGKGTFQEIDTWKNSTSISFFETKGFYLLPSGASPQLVGVTPDIESNTTDEIVHEGLLYQNPIQPQPLVKQAKIDTNLIDRITGILQQ